jgi:hypothetical protein
MPSGTLVWLRGRHLNLRSGSCRIMSLIFSLGELICCPKIGHYSLAQSQSCRSGPVGIGFDSTLHPPQLFAFSRCKDASTVGYATWLRKIVSDRPRRMLGRVRSTAFGPGLCGLNLVADLNEKSTFLTQRSHDRVGKRLVGAKLSSSRCSTKFRFSNSGWTIAESQHRTAPKRLNDRRQSAKARP